MNVWARRAVGAVALVGAGGLILVFAPREKAPASVSPITPDLLKPGAMREALVPIDAAPERSDARPPTRLATVAHVANTCNARFDVDGDVALDKDAIAAAVLRAYDPAAHHTKTLDVDASAPDAPAEFDVVSCRGTRVRVFGAPEAPKGAVSVIAFPLTGTPGTLADAGLEGVVGARVLVGHQGGLCDEEAGFIALLTLRDRTVETKGLAEWAGFGCGGPDQPMSISQWGNGWVLLESVGEHSGEQPSAQDTYAVWRVDEATRELRRLGHVLVGLEQEHLMGQPPSNKPRATMTGEVSPTAEGIVVHETWKYIPTHWDEINHYIDVAGAKPRVVKLDRRYWIEKDEVKRSPEDGPE